MAESKLTKQHENKFSTFMDIETVLDRNNEIVNRIPALSDSVANFKQVIRDITIKAEIKNSVQKGTSETKNVKRFELEEITMELASALLALGNKTNNEVIKAIADIPKSALERMRDTEVTNKANVILNTLTENAQVLMPFGITEDDIGNLRKKIENYKNSSSEKSGSFTESVVITKTLKELFQNGMDLLDKEIDNMINSLQTKEKNFYASYYAVRSVKNLGVRHKKPDQMAVSSQ